MATELDEAKAEIQKLHALVKAMEWGSCDDCGNRWYCTECHGYFKRGHEVGCPVGEVVGGPWAKPEEGE